MKKKWNLVIDCARCHDCNDCFLADKDEFVGNDFLPYSLSQPWSGHRWLDIHRKERGQYPIIQVCYLPLPCMHCDEPPCIKEAPEGSVYKRDDGLVIIDPVKAKDCPELVDSCPYHAIWWNEEARVAQKCTGCAHLLDNGWQEPRCAQVCPTGAIRFISTSDEEMSHIAEAEGLGTYKAGYNTKPRVFYKNLHLWEKAFIAASVAYQDTDECAEGAVLTVACKGERIGENSTNNYGEVIVDKLEPGIEYDITISAAGCRPYRAVVRLGDSLTLGVVMLERN